ncbi:hypothetical protein BH10BAC2_BH10BAC2_02600 [soil metagenome]
MNNSQLLYKISELQYSISRKELEYANAIKKGDKTDISLYQADLELLQEELASLQKQFDTVQVENAKVLAQPAKKTRKWIGFFKFRVAGKE